MQFSEGVLARRLKAGAGGNTPSAAKKAPGMGAPGPRGGKKKLSPSNTSGAGSMFKKGSPGRMFKALHNAPKPR